MNTSHIISEKWIAAELSFESSEQYNLPEQSDVIMDVQFVHQESGKILTVPSFWDGGNNFKVRFAPTECGIWNYTTVCKTDGSLNGITGTAEAKEYSGNLDIYKHGFIKTEAGKKYFIYDDGTPFFYLGDTHWAMLKEEFDSAGATAGNIKTNSHFKYIVDKRVEQGFTVYQSEPIDAPFKLTAGEFTEKEVHGFQIADRYFQYLAEKGLVHANAQFFFSSFMTKELMENKVYLEKISRYWAARFGAYPVMWTLGQEIDNDRYLEHGDHNLFTADTNPWVLIAEYLHKYDAYSHPLSGHQEHWARTTVTGRGADQERCSSGGKSAFLSEEVTKRTGHNWYAAQWMNDLGMPVLFEAPKDYWNSPKVAIDYESAYCYLDTKNFGARVHAWSAFLNGFAGHGYGAVDMWYYNTGYQSNIEKNDGYETITPEDKKTKWSTAIEFESGYQMGYLRQFLEKFDWWNLVPDFDNKNAFIPSENAFYSCATVKNDIYVVCFYNRTEDTGSFVNMDTNSTYKLQWFNTRTNEYSLIGNVAPEKDGSYKLPNKEQSLDWVVIAEKNK